jgi:hypothetical protein
MVGDKNLSVIKMHGPTIKILIMYFSTLSCYLVPLRLKYSPQHPILKYPQPTFLPQCKRPKYRFSFLLNQNQAKVRYVYRTA